MILVHHRPAINRLRPYMSGRMLMLGNQENHIGIDPKKLFGVDDYTTLDPDGGNLEWDLGGYLETDLRFDTVFNLGTIEHVWDAHTAWSNAAGLVRTGGHFINHSPIEHWPGHGIHVTGERYIRDFFRLNGFRICTAWTEEHPRGTVFWMAAKKAKDVDVFAKPQQRFNGGKAVR